MNAFKYWKISKFAKRTNWKGFPIIYKASVAEIKAAADKLKAHRKIISNNGAGNWGYLKGNIEGYNFDSTKMWGAVSENIGKKETHIFSATQLTWHRITDSEYRMLNSLAKALGANSGDVINGIVKKTYPYIKGEIKIVSELPYCPSCTRIIDQFYQMFPKVKIVIVDGAK